MAACKLQKFFATRWSKPFWYICI